MNKTSVAIVLFSVIALVNAQCSCQSKPPVEIRYPGEACECTRQYPVQLEIPKVTEHRDAHYDYGFTIERPQEAPQEVKYTFDFHMEKPKTVPAASLGTYAFEVQAPVQKPEEQPKRYSFDYQIQTPVVAKSPSTLEGLLAHVDKVVVQKPDCQDKNSCQCSGYKPTIDLLQRCPKHGHLYQYGGPLHPNQQRYNIDFRTIEQPITNVAIASSDRAKRNVVNPLIKIKGLLPDLRPNNQILKVPQSVEDKQQSRIDQIIKQNFGEDPTENIEELLKPKPLGPTQKINAEAEKSKLQTDMPTPVTDEFLSKIKPKLDAARANFRRQITRIVNKARLDAIKVNRVMQKRSTETDSSDEGEYLPDGFDESFEPIWIADVSVEDQGTENDIEPKSANLPNNDDEPIASADRFRKHCDRCGELAKKFPCPSCGDIPQETSPQIVRTNSMRYAPEYETQSRHVPDRMIPANDGATVGSYHGQPAYGELKDILSKNSDAIHLQNRGVGHDHLIQPMNFEHAASAIRFIQELTQRNNEYNEGYRSNHNSHDGGAGEHNFHSKRSFEIVPLAEKDDGSVFVKISPVKNPKWDVKSRLSENRKSKITSSSAKEEVTEVKTQLASPAKEDDNFGGIGNQKTNLKKFVRNGKQYEILALNGSDDESGSSVEDLEILKYIYEVNQKAHANDDASDSNNLTNNNAQVET